MQALVLSCRNWEFTDEKTGEVRSGVTLQYLEDGCVENTGNNRGWFPFKLSGPSNLKSVFEQVPAVCELDIRRRPGRDGKAQDTLVNATLLHPVNTADIMKGTKKSA